MKRVFIIVIVLVPSSSSFSQTVAEWTQQKQTQRAYLIQQIFALQGFLGYLKKGYNIAQKGINSIQNIKNGEWSLHQNFIGSLKLVNPSIKKCPKVADIIAIQIRIIKQSKSFLRECLREGQFSLDEIMYLQKICNNLLSECLKHIDELFMVATSGELEMRDDERIKRIEKVYEEMRDNYLFLKSFEGSMSYLSKQRLQEKLEIEVSKKINKLN